MKQTYTYIFSKCCDRELQMKIENRSDFESDIESDPISLQWGKRKNRKIGKKIRIVKEQY